MFALEVNGKVINFFTLLTHEGNETSRGNCDDYLCHLYTFSIKTVIAMERAFPLPLPTPPFTCIREEWAGTDSSS